MAYLRVATSRRPGCEGDDGVGAAALLCELHSDTGASVRSRGGTPVIQVWGERAGGESIDEARGRGSDTRENCQVRRNSRRHHERAGERVRVRDATCVRNKGP